MVSFKRIYANFDRLLQIKLITQDSGGRLLGNSLKMAQLESWRTLIGELSVANYLYRWTLEFSWLSYSSPHVPTSINGSWNTPLHDFRYAFRESDQFNFKFATVRYLQDRFNCNFSCQLNGIAKHAAADRRKCD